MTATTETAVFAEEGPREVALRDGEGSALFRDQLFSPGARSVVNGDLSRDNGSSGLNEEVSVRTGKASTKAQEISPRSEKNSAYSAMSSNGNRNSVDLN